MLRLARVDDSKQNSRNPHPAVPAGDLPVWKQRLPMRITYFRMVIVPWIVLALALQKPIYNYLAAFGFILASISDYYDGYFARKFNASTTLGKFFDPIADKVLVTCILVQLVALNKIDPTMVMVILARDILIGGLRQVAAADQIIISAKAGGKWKTALQMVAIPAIMIVQPGEADIIVTIGKWVLWGSTLLSVTSGLQYYFSYLKVVRSSK